MAHVVGWAVVRVFLATAVHAAEPENLAPKAKVAANSEYSADYLAKWAVDGKIPAACCKQDTRQAWCVRGSDTKCSGEFTLTWDTPVAVAEIVYFGRTGQLIEECFKDYEVYFDGAAVPAVRGTFEKRHGAQRIPLPKKTVGTIRIAFLSAYTTTTHPGASEIAVFGSSPTDNQILAMSVPRWNRTDRSSERRQRPGVHYELDARSGYLRPSHGRRAVRKRYARLPSGRDL